MLRKLFNKKSIQALNAKPTLDTLEDRTVLTGAVDFQPPVEYNVGGGPDAVTVGDFNGDTILDIAVANSYDDEVSILLGNGDGTFGAATNFDVGDRPLAIYFELLLQFENTS